MRSNFQLDFKATALPTCAYAYAFYGKLLVMVSNISIGTAHAAYIQFKENFYFIFKLFAAFLENITLSIYI